MITTIPVDLDENQHFTDQSGYTPLAYVSSPQNTYKVLSVRQCITEINGSTAISGSLAGGWCLEDLQSISIAPKIKNNTVSLLADGLLTQLAVAGSVLGVDQKLDREIDSALETYYQSFKSSEI